MTERALPRVPAAVALVVHDERALVLRRRFEERSFPGRWCLPGGRIEEGESPRDAVLRETEEETGLRILLGRELGVRRVHAPHRPIEFVIHCFAARAGIAEVVLSAEHVASRWISRSEAARADGLLPSGLAGEVTRELLERFSRDAV